MDIRLKKITHASVVGIVLNLSLVGLKTLVGVVSGSVSVLTDAINNLTDTMSAIVTLVGTKLAQKKPDHEHPHGHGRIEYIAAIMVGLIIFVVGIGAMLTSVPLIFEPKMASYSAGSMIVIFATVVAKLWFSGYAKKLGGEVESGSLKATGVDALFDALLSLGTLVGAGISLLFGVSIDGWIGVIISAFIIRSAVEILSDGMVDVIGKRVDEKLARKLRARILEHDEVEGVRKLILHDYGPMKTSGIARIEIDPEMKIKDYARLSHEIEKEIDDEFNVKLTVGVA